MLKIFRQTSFLAAVGILLVIFIPGYAKIQELRQKNQELEASVRKLQAENSAFQQEKERLENDPEYLEQVGRKELGIAGYKNNQEYAHCRKKRCLPEYLEHLLLAKLSGIDRFFTQFLFNPKQFIIFTDAVSPGKRAGFDLSGIGGHGQMGDGGVFGFAGAVRDNRAVFILLGDVDGLQSLG